MTYFRTKAFARVISFSLLLSCLIALAACGRGGKLMNKDYFYVSAPQVNLRDRLSTVYNKVGVVKNGERVRALEKSKRFYRVRTDGGAEGWIEVRYLVAQDIFDGFEKLKTDNVKITGQARGAARADLNMHLTPDRDGEHLYQMKEGEKLEVLKRAITEKKTTAPAKIQSVKDTSDKQSDEPAKVYEDWWLVRDTQQRVGWVLARMVDIDVPFDIAQYAEGQRIVATFPLNYVPDMDPATGQTKSVPQYLMLTTEPKDGLPFDFNQIRVFSWNQKRHRYETAYREHALCGVFPVTVGHEVFDKEGDLPSFVLSLKDSTGNTVQRKYKMNGPIVRRVMTPAEEQADRADRAQRAAQRKAERSKGKSKSH